MKTAYRIAKALKNTTAKGFLLVINRIGTATVAFRFSYGAFIIYDF